MCGLTGYWDFKTRHEEQYLQHEIATMRDTLLHRGPDGAGSWVDAKQGVALGHRRLAILDLSPHGQQPMVSHNQRYVLVFNGEIYNHQEIKQLLEQEGNAPAWHGHSDTEIILAAFVAWGIEATLQRMVGMFAMALWDQREQLLYLLRDRMGEKPLYYGLIDNYFIFGSELKSLKAHHAWQQAIDPSALSLFMQYNCIPAPHTIYQQIYKLPPASMLVINAQQQIKLNNYWKLPQQSGLAAISSANQAKEILQSKLANAVGLQMVADVPLGAFLSGGIDSSLVVALMQAKSSKPVKTFTIGFSDANYNEAPYAKAIAQHLGTEHTELYLDSATTRAVIPNLADFYDEPFADSSQLPTYIVSKLTREKVTVSLSGDGGDELFAGYNRYTWVPQIWNMIQKCPIPLRKVLGNMLLQVSPQRWNSFARWLSWLVPRLRSGGNIGDKVHKLAGLFTARSAQDIYLQLVTHWREFDQVVLAKRDVLNPSSIIPNQPFDRLVEGMIRQDMARYLPDDILVKVDRAGMAVSLETRMPLLDHRVVEFAWNLPMEFKIHNGQRKWLLRQLLADYVPRELFERPKMGFGVPISNWLRGPLQEWAQDLLSPNMLAKHGLLDTQIIQSKLREHMSGTRNWQYHLWDVLIFQSWYEANYG